MVTQPWKYLDIYFIYLASIMEVEDRWQHKVYSGQSLHSSAELHTTEGKGLEKVADVALMAAAQTVNSSQTLQTLESSIKENHEILLNTAKVLTLP